MDLVSVPSRKCILIALGWSSQESSQESFQTLVSNGLKLGMHFYIVAQISREQRCRSVSANVPQSLLNYRTVDISDCRDTELLRYRTVEIPNFRYKCRVTVELPKQVVRYRESAKYCTRLESPDLSDSKTFRALFPNAPKLRTSSQIKSFFQNPTLSPIQLFELKIINSQVI